MFPELKQLLGYLEDNLDEQKIIAADNLHQAALCWQEVPRLPVIASYPYPREAEYQPFPHAETFDAPAIMLFNQLISAFDASIYLSEKVGDDLPLTVRANFGCVLIASMFGAEVEQVENNPPWIRHGKHEITYQQITRSSSGDLKMDLILKAASYYQYYRDVLANYPRLLKYIYLTLPDLQGPFDNLELIRGSDILADMYIRKDELLEAMSAVTGAQIEITNYFLQFTKETRPGFSHQHCFPQKGGILIRNDSSIMVSPQMYREMIAPFDKRILGHFGGGIHSCGNVDKIIPEYLSLEPLECFDFGQSEMNDVAAIYELAKEKRIPLMRIAVTEEELASRTIQEKYPTGVSLIFRAKSFEHAKAVISDYKSICSE